jgi:selenide,water dikinase
LQVVRLLSTSTAFQTITVVDANSESVYCGSIPENIVGTNRNKTSTTAAAEWKIDLQELCTAHNRHNNNIRFVQGKVTDIDFTSKVVQLETSTSTTATTNIPYDMISIDIGSKSKSIREIPGAYENVIPTRPMKLLMEKLQEIEKNFGNDGVAETKNKVPAATDDQPTQPRPLHVAVVGGGASGIELALSIVGRWKPMVANRTLHVSLVTSDQILFPENPSARKRLKDILLDKGIYMIFHSAVVRVEKGFLHLQSGMEVPFDHCLWATGPGPHYLARSLQRRGLDVTEDGWIQVQSTLQSLSYPEVFATGDCASFIDDPLPKSGVYALQEGPVLAKNLDRYARNQPLENFEPNLEDLKFLNCGDGTAMGFAFGLVLRGEWVYEVKQAMDRRHFLSLTGGSGSSTANPDGILQDDFTYRCNTDVFQQIVLLPPADAAKLLTQINVDNYQEAWAILERMSLDKDYRDGVMKEYNRIHVFMERQSSDQDKRQKKDDHQQPPQTPTPLQFLNWLLHAKS